MVNSSKVDNIIYCNEIWNSLLQSLRQKSLKYFMKDKHIFFSRFPLSHVWLLRNSSSCLAVTQHHVNLVMSFYNAYQVSLTCFFDVFKIYEEIQPICIVHCHITVQLCSSPQITNKQYRQQFYNKNVQIKIERITKKSSSVASSTFNVVVFSCINKLLGKFTWAAVLAIIRNNWQSSARVT